MRDLPFEWLEDGAMYTAQTPDARVVITQVQDLLSHRHSFGTRRFRLRIEFHDGTIETVQHIFESFGSAEGWAYLVLQERDAERHDRAELDELLATVAHCRELLASEGDQLHKERLDRIATIIKKHYGVEP